MTNDQWFLLIGCLLLAMGLTSSLLERSPVTSAIIYLAVGLLFGPTVLNLFHFNPLKESATLELLTEVAVLISLFSAGVKMPVPFRFSSWRAPILLATVSMVITVGLVAAFADWVLGLPLGAAVLLGAILAPTDPVLATDVQSRHPGDRSSGGIDSQGKKPILKIAETSNNPGGTQVERTCEAKQSMNR